MVNNFRWHLCQFPFVGIFGHVLVCGQLRRRQLTSDYDDVNCYFTPSPKTRTRTSRKRLGSPVFISSHIPVMLFPNVSVFVQVARRRGATDIIIIIIIMGCHQLFYTIAANTNAIANGWEMTRVRSHDSWVAIQLAKLWFDFWLEKRLEIPF